MISPARVVSVSIWCIRWWFELTNNISLFHNISLIAGTVGHYSSQMLSKLKDETRLFGTRVSVTACTSCLFLISSSSNLLAKVESLAFVSKSSGRESCHGGHPGVLG